MLDYKYCSKCGVTTNLIKMSKYIRNNVGKQYYYCNPCNALKTKKYHNTLVGKMAFLIANKKYYRGKGKNIRRAYRFRNKEKVRLWRKAEYIKHRYGYIAYSYNRKAFLRSLGQLTKVVVQRVYEDNIKQYGTLTCYLCEKPIEFGQDNLEHKQPISRGGTNNKDNLGIAHQICNDIKGKKTIEEYQGYLRDIQALQG